MKKILRVLGICLALQAIAVPVQTTVQAQQAQQEMPAYAKWGKLAIKETKEKYPNAKIVDYLHVGRETKGEHTTENFKFWLKEDKKEFGINVKIRFITQTEKLVTIDMIEVEK